MNNEIIEIVSTEEKNHPVVPIIGERTLSLVESLKKVDSEGKVILISEAQDILSHCIFPGENGNITNIAVGYVQSGKTMSYTVLTSLAADNGFKMVIYLTGTKTNLQEQTYERLRKDIRKIEDSSDSFKIIPDGDFSIPEIKDYLQDDDYFLLFPILKQYNHIEALSELFENTEIKPLLDKKAVLIVDDEADQASFNTYARKNSQNEDWEDDEYSKTYANIIRLKSSLPNHSYVQYTATPQAAFLIDNNDILSPKYHTVLTEGKGYTGGKFFFKNKDRQYVIQIPDDEIFHLKRNPLPDRPLSFEKALMQFFISVAIVVRIQKREPYLSMMIHIDGLTPSNEKFKKWTDETISEWTRMFQESRRDISWPAFEKKLVEAYKEITKYTENRPSFEDVMEALPKTLKNKKTYLIQGNSNPKIEWEDYKAHVLVGGDMLNRGFTVENLSMTYMPRSPRGIATADTIEQRCRFFGYKQNYSDVIRIYLSQKSINEFNAYVDHEEMLRANLKQCKTLKEFAQQAKTMVLSPLLKPTRKNILSSSLIRNKMTDWRQMRSLHDIAENNARVKKFKAMVNNWVLEKDYNNIMRNHPSAKVPVDQFVEFFSKISYSDLPNIARKVATIQYLDYLFKRGIISYVKVYDMSSDNLRERKMADGIPNNLQEGAAKNGSYPGDKAFIDEEGNSICVQIHHILIKESSSVKYGNVDLYNFAIYYPKELSESYISMNLNDEED